MLVAVGGHSRNIGKTSVVAGLIAALPECDWTALKITQYGHGVCSTAGEVCDCAVEYDHPYALTEERDAANGTDTGRFLAAGARRSFWLRTAAGQLGNAVSAIRGICEASRNTIVESNSILQFFKPDLYLVVLDFAIHDFKESTLRYLDRADALVVIDGGVQAPAWSGVSPRLWKMKPRFPVNPPQYMTAAIAEFVARASLAARS